MCLFRSLFRYNIYFTECEPGFQPCNQEKLYILPPQSGTQSYLHQPSSNILMIFESCLAQSCKYLSRCSLCTFAFFSSTSKDKHAPIFMSLYTLSHHCPENEGGIRTLINEKDCGSLSL